MRASEGVLADPCMILPTKAHIQIGFMRSMWQALSFAPYLVIRLEFSIEHSSIDKAITLRQAKRVAWEVVLEALGTVSRLVVETSRTEVQILFASNPRTRFLSLSFRDSQALTLIRPHYG